MTGERELAETLDAVGFELSTAGDVRGDALHTAAERLLQTGSLQDELALDVDLKNRTHDELLRIAVRACGALMVFAGNLTTEESDEVDTSEAVEAAHDHMIVESRRTLGRIIRDFPSKPA